MKKLLVQNSSDLEVGLGLSKINQNQNHIGFIYQSESGNGLKICHFCWHYDLRNEPFSLNSKYLVAPIQLEESNLKYLASVLEAISDINRAAIPYGFRVPIQSFNEKNMYVGGIEGEGLTCATFVLEVMKKNGYLILDESTWEIRESDAGWQSDIVGHLARSHGVEGVHLERMREIIGKVVRFRPVEVFASGIVEPVQWAISFQDADKLSHAIFEHLASLP